MDAFMRPLTVGFPCIRNEAGEVREFLPDLVSAAAGSGVPVLIERGYGSRMGLDAMDYLQASPNIHVVDRVTAFSSSIVLLLRPSDDALDLLPANSTFVAMLHFPTHKERAKTFKEHGIHALALDLIADDNGNRLVENMQAVGWNGLDVAFKVLERTRPDLQATREPTRVTVLGAGLVGKHAVEAATKYGDLERNERLARSGSRGVEVTVLGRNMTRDEDYLGFRLSRSDILVDATFRSDPSIPVVPNELVAEHPPHAVIADLAVDPYLENDDPPVVRGIEGIPRGDLDRYVFPPDDAAWDLVPSWVSTRNRRWVVSCYSWPGIRPEPCMRRYGAQLHPLMRTLIRTGGAPLLNEKGGYFERALYRGSLAAWIDKL